MREKGGRVSHSEAIRIGFAAERLAQRLLQEDNHLVVRSAGSKGPFDLAAIKDAHTRLIQVKSRPTAQYWEEVESFATKLLRRYVRSHTSLLSAHTCIEIWVWFPFDGRVYSVCSAGFWSPHWGIWYPQKPSPA